MNVRFSRVQVLDVRRVFGALEVTLRYGAVQRTDAGGLVEYKDGDDAVNRPGGGLVEYKDGDDAVNRPGGGLLYKDGEDGVNRPGGGLLYKDGEDGVNRPGGGLLYKDGEDGVNRPRLSSKITSLSFFA
jgi:hypothetical protein